MQDNLQAGGLTVPGDQQSWTILVVVVIILIAGAAGGWAAYLSQPQRQARVGRDPPALSRSVFIVLGIVAAACVPLFLSLLKSSLLSDVFKAGASTSSYESYLVFAGLCLVAAFSSRRFIETVTDQIIRKVDQARRDAAEAKVVASEANVVAQEAVSEMEAADEASAASSPELLAAAALDESDDDGVMEAIREDERRVLRSMANRTYRTASGISKDSGVPRHQVSDLLETLADRKLILATKSPRTGGARWAISKRGMRAIAG